MATLSAVPNTEKQPTRLTRGVSRTKPSLLQQKLCEQFSDIVLQSLSPLYSTENVNDKILSVLKQIPTDSWNTIDENGQYTHIIEYLLPIKWPLLKTLKPTIKNIESCDTTGSLNPILKIFALYYLKEIDKSENSLITYTPGEFIKEYGNWVQSHINENINKHKTINIFKNDVNAQVQGNRIYQAFGQLNSVALNLRKICQLASDRGNLRERATYLMQLYRYKDTIMTAGIESFALRYHKDFQSYNEDTNNTQDSEVKRKFRDVLYSKDCKLKNLFDNITVQMDLNLTVDNEHGTSTLRLPSALEPKLKRVVDYTKKALTGKDSPSIIIVCKNIETAEQIYDALSFDSKLADFSGSLLLPKHSKEKRKAALESLADDTTDFIVTTELKSVPLSSLKGQIRLLFTNQHALQIKFYPWIEAVVNEDTQVRAVIFTQEKSSEEGKRNRAKRIPSFPLTPYNNPKTLTQQTKDAIHPNAQMMFVVHQTISGIFNLIAKYGRLQSNEVQDFTDKAKNIHSLTSQLLPNAANQQKFKKDLTTLLYNRLHEAWKISLDISQYEDTLATKEKIFGLCYQMLRRIGGYKNNHDSSQIYKAAFIDAKERFINDFNKDNQPKNGVYSPLDSEALRTFLLH